MSVIAAIKETAEAAGAVAKEVTQRDAENNATDMKANVEAQRDRAVADQAAKAVAAGDLDEIRKESAE